MEEPLHQTRWQSLGSTLNAEHRFVTHLDPPLGRLSEAGGAYRQSRLTREPSTRSTRPKATPGLRRNSSAKLSAQIRRFVNRMAWHKRSKSYLFGQSYLQRQPSFVMTPDRSTLTYRFRLRDLAKRRPYPRYEHSSQPIAVWKNERPMDVLLNQGQGLTMPSVPASNPHSADADRAYTPVDRPLPQRQDLAANGPQTANQRLRSESPTPQKWTKVSLPVKQEHHSESLWHEEQQPRTAEATSTPQNKADQSGSGSGTGTGSGSGTNNSRTHASKASTSLSIFDDIPATPLESRVLPSAPSQMRPVSLPFATGTVPDDRAPRSPTSARSRYRPESWRRSAIVTRTEREQEPELDVAIEFVSAWGTYLRRAIASRAAAERKRLSWEQSSENRWIDDMSGSELDLLSTSTTSTGTGSDAYGSSSASHDHSETSHSSEDPPRSDADSESSSLLSGSSSLSGHSSPGDPESSSIVSGPASFNTPLSTPNSEPRISSASIQHTPEAITIPNTTGITSSPRHPSSVYVHSPMKSTSSLAPMNSPRALAAMARDSASRLRLVDPLEGADQKHPAVLQPEAETPILRPEPIYASELPDPSNMVDGSHIDFLKDVSQWQAEDSDRETSAERSEHFATSDRVPALRVNRSEVSRDLSSTLDMPSEDFDFADRSVSRKRPLPVSPASTPPPLSNDDKASFIKPEQLVIHKRGSSTSLISVEDAPSLLKSQSIKRIKNSSHKRVKSSASREQLLLVRQNTLRSRWAEEDSDTDASVHSKLRATS